jgi:hypothetical protein
MNTANVSNVKLGERIKATFRSGSIDGAGGEVGRHFEQFGTEKRAFYVRCI